MAFWGIVLWGEMRGSNWRVRGWFGVMCVGFIISLVLVVLAGLVNKKKDQP